LYIRIGFVIRTRYHEDFFIPGISPFLAVSRKQMRQRPKSLI